MSWEEQIKKAPFLDRDISDLESKGKCRARIRFTRV